MGGAGTVLQAKWQDGKEGLQEWSEPMNGLRWFFNPQTEQMAFERESSSQPLPEEHAKYEGVWQTYRQWLKMGWGLAQPAVSSSSGKPSFTRLKETGERRYEMMMKAMSTSEGGSVDPRVQSARDWYFLQYYDTQPSEELSGTELQINSDYNSAPDSLSTGYKGNYHNAFDFGTETMVASHNYALQGGEQYYNPVSGKAEKFSNSEILFQQYKQIQQKVQSKSLVSGKARMKYLKRSRISGDGNAQAKMILQETGMVKESEPVYNAGTPGFYALLAIPNVTAAVWLVVDHGAELGLKGIKSIQILKNLSALIEFDLA